MNMTVKETTTLSYSVEVEINADTATKLCNIAAKVDKATAVWVLRQMIPSLSVSAAFSFIKELCEQHPI